jgi:flagellar basal body-associated protein FliL
MARQIRPTPLRARLGLFLGSLAVVLAGALLLVPAQAQETPESSPQTTPVASPETTPEATTPAGTATGTVVRVEVDQPVEPIKSGEVFEARIVVDDVEHLSGFSLFVAYDPDKIRPIDIEDSGDEPTPTSQPGGPPGLTARGTLVQAERVGDLVASSERSESLTCAPPAAQDDRVGVLCSTFDLPVCLGGPPGASGSGVLAVIPFESRGGGLTELRIEDSTLVLDNWEDPCDPGTSSALAIDHTTEGASVELAAKEDSNTMLIVIIAIVVVAVLAAGGAGGYWWYRQRSAAPPAS